MEKRGDFREGESREDLDMTKKASIDAKSTLDGIISNVGSDPVTNIKVLSNCRSCNDLREYRAKQAALRARKYRE